MRYAWYIMKSKFPNISRLLVAILDFQNGG